MQTSKFERIEDFPMDFLSNIGEILNDSNKYTELEKILSKSGLMFESSLYKHQFTIHTNDELKKLKDLINKKLIPA